MQDHLRLPVAPSNLLKEGIPHQVIWAKPAEAMDMRRAATHRAILHNKVAMRLQVGRAGAESKLRTRGNPPKTGMVRKAEVMVGRPGRKGQVGAFLGAVWVGVQRGQRRPVPRVIGLLDQIPQRPRLRRSGSSPLACRTTWAKAIQRLKKPA